MASLSELKKDFERLAKRDRLSHSYLFFGEAPKSAHAFLCSFAQFLEAGAWEENAVLSDMKAWSGEEGEIGIDAVRAMQEFLYRMPARSPKRTLIVHRMDRLTLPAQHAFLKIAEEPPPHALIMATVLQPDTLVAPLASRFQKYYVSGVDEGDEKKGETLVAEFLKRDEKGRKEWLKALVEDDVAVVAFMRAMLLHLRKGFPRTARVAGELLRREALMEQYNVNRRLQLEAVLLGVTDAKWKDQK